MCAKYNRSATSYICYVPTCCNIPSSSPKHITFIMATTPAKRITIHKHCRVAPPVGDGEVVEQVLKTTYMDMPWVYFNPIQCVLFFRFPCSKVHFDETIIPNLKQSLSQALKHYLIVAGNVYIPLESGMPELRYVSGDSVSFIIAESDGDIEFDYLTGNHPRDACQFYEFVPYLPELKIDPDNEFKTMPVLSAQVTLFPDKGLSLGWATHHVAGDATSFIRFLKAWSSLANVGKDVDTYDFLAKNSLHSLFDRSVIADPSGRRANIYWNQIKKSGRIAPPPKLPTDKLRQTFGLTKSDMQKLRNSALAKKPWLVHLSTYTIVSAYLWSCFVKIASKIGEEVDAQEPEFFLMSVDARARLEPPVPLEYYGNCIVPAVVGSTHGELKGDDGFSNAVELIGDVISKQINNKEEFMKSADNQLERIRPIFGKRLLTVNGLPNFDMYGTDFGFGKTYKYEVLSIDGANCMSLCKSRDSEGGSEIGLTLPKPKLDAFASIFSEGLN